MIPMADELEQVNPGPEGEIRTLESFLDVVIVGQENGVPRSEFEFKDRPILVNDLSHIGVHLGREQVGHIAQDGPSTGSYRRDEDVALIIL